MKIFPLTIYVLLKPFIQILPSDSKKSLWDSRTTATFGTSFELHQVWNDLGSPLNTKYQTTSWTSRELWTPTTMLLQYMYPFGQMMARLKLSWRSSIYRGAAERFNFIVLRGCCCCNCSVFPFAPGESLREIM
jgi:hypothetical protein